MKNDELVHTHISERDVDLLLVEELRCSAIFQEWFLASVSESTPGIAKPALHLADIKHSVTAIGKGAGESDIQVLFQRNEVDQPLMFLMENKIDAEFQQDQGQRYRERAERFVREQRCARCLCVLIAPNAYVEATDQVEFFDHVITYEEIAAFLAHRARVSHGETALRHVHRGGMLEQAVERQRRGYCPVIDSAVTEFWSAYYRRSTEIAPSLRMRKPDPKPTQSTFIAFPDALVQDPSVECRIKHKLPWGRVELEIAGWAGHRKAVEPDLTPLLEGAMKLRTATKSLAVSISLPKADPIEPFEHHRDTVDAGLRAALQLQAWHESHVAKLAACADRIGTVSQTDDAL